MIPLSILIKPEDIVKPIHLTTDTAEQSSYFIARILMDVVRWLLKLVGLGGNSTAYIWCYTIVVLLFAFAVGWLVQTCVVFVLNRFSRHVKWPIYRDMVNRHFFSKLCRIIPPIIFLILIQFTLYKHATLAMWLTRLSWMYIVIIFARTFSTMSDVTWNHIDSRENTRHLPLKGIVQVVKLIIWIFAVIIVAAILFNKSPGKLLAGIGAFAAVLMLVFKDSILGVVAGVQLAQNDSLHVGDWISVNNGDANGTVREVSLTAVKIENWDKTVSTVPPYNLITSGFKNYLNMQQSGTRRIQRSYMIDADSVIPTTPEMLAEFADIPMMKEWIETKIEQQKAGKVENVNNSAGLVDGSIETNLGVFRAYVMMYLKASAEIDHNSDCFVSTLAQTPYGIPFQVYCFTSTSSWIPYEGIQSTLFEHIAAMLASFKLYTFESASGRDTMIEGWLSPGKNPNDVFGIPVPFSRQTPPSPSGQTSTTPPSPTQN